MVNMTELSARDLKHIWHPCMQMKDFETQPLLEIRSAKGCYLYTNHGRLIDGIASWWCKSLGHSHPAVIHAISEQLVKFEHVISANTTHPLMVELAEKLAEITGKQRIFFASDGSSAVEIAMKLSLHANQIKGNNQRTEFAALKNSYHGETLAALSVSDLGVYSKPYQGMGTKCHFIEHIPYFNADEPHDNDYVQQCWNQTVVFLEPIKHALSAILVEPLVQGSGGMLCYSPAYLHLLANWAKENDIYLIADEIMTGIGRTGSWLACSQADVSPDLICLSKGLTGGTIPFSCVMINEEIYQLFYDDYHKGKSFLHSHTHSGNALAIAAALATLNTIEQDGLLEKASSLGVFMREQLNQIAEETGYLKNVRGIGAIAAADMPFPLEMRLGKQLEQEALSRGALLRPLGHTVYWLPPLNIEQETIVKLGEITLNSIMAVCS
ncbi:adenosylmethionine--8-amino-7-oxononanoate transaminase [Legionella dresdenensis]|uniref:Adenosylmethionine-8-amino-7-oxononanoate aminotransferase n=1 Tax=Legionella dresdenensis TaxID=450200 RepID=A0ABV8CBI6_9GAMM